MEISSKQTSENVQFTSILHKCGSELSGIGNFLQDKAKEITTVYTKGEGSSASASVAKQVVTIPVKQKKTEKHKHEHFYEAPVAVPSDKTIVYNEEISEIPKLDYDDDRYIMIPKIGSPCGQKRRYYLVVQTLKMMMLMVMK